MSYSVLARKWRPTSLSAMVGQEHILTIIANSILQNRVHHAYLFCGTRGVGKTTLARIFTKCLNCKDGPTPTPCGKCDACVQIDQGCYPDLIEIDAASRTKVEDTRELLDNIPYAPTSGRTKVYLIDEVHMLSGHSFNALLKTLEEPPAHVKFLLATTDPQKLPVTVLSRCLKLSLKMLSVSQISDHLEVILQAEKIDFEKSALSVIAEAACGSMRDALSLLDQLIVFSGDKLTEEKACQLLGIETRYLHPKLLTSLVEKKEEELFHWVRLIEEKGGDFLRTLDHLLHLLYVIALYQKKTKLISTESPDYFEELPHLSKQLSEEDTQLLYQIFLAGKRDFSFAPTAKIGFEMTLLRAMDFYPLDMTQAVRENDKESSAPEKREINTTNWKTILAELNLQGVTLKIAMEAKIGKIQQNRLDLILPKQYHSLCNEKQQELLRSAISAWMKNKVEVTFNFQDDIINEPSPPLPQLDKPQEDKNLARLLAMFDADIHETITTRGNDAK